MLQESDTLNSERAYSATFIQEKIN